MEANREAIILNVKNGRSCENLLEKQPGVDSNETDNIQNTPGERILEERPPSEILKIYLKSLGHYGRKKQHRCISRELHRITKS